MFPALMLLPWAHAGDSWMQSCTQEIQAIAEARYGAPADSASVQVLPGSESYPGSLSFQWTRGDAVVSLDVTAESGKGHPGLRAQMWSFGREAAYSASSATHRGTVGLSEAGRVVARVELEGELAPALDACLLAAQEQALATWDGSNLERTLRAIATAPACDDSCRCVLAGPPLATEPAGSLVAVRTIASFIARTYQTAPQRYRTTLVTWPELLEGAVATHSAALPGYPWGNRTIRVPDASPWPPGYSGMGHPVFSPRSAATPERLSFTPHNHADLSATIEMPEGARLVAWEQVMPWFLLLAVEQEETIGWYVLTYPSLELDEEAAALSYCF